MDPGARGVSFMKKIEALSVKIYADGANLAAMQELYQRPYVKGFTTNPTLMRKAGITDYPTFARDVLRAIPDRPISFEVFSDEFPEMERQAREIANWGSNVYVKIPVSNTRRHPAYDLVRQLSRDGLQINVTAVMTLDQVQAVTNALAGGAASCISVFAGRIADTGRDPLPLMTEALRIMAGAPRAELIWASPRELLNIFHAESVGCHIITVTGDILSKMATIGKPLDEFSLDTVRMFYNDATAARFTV